MGELLGWLSRLGLLNGLVKINSMRHMTRRTGVVVVIPKLLIRQLIEELLISDPDSLSRQNV